MNMYPTPRPTRITNHGSLFTTTMAKDYQYGFAITADADTNFAQADMVNTANMSPLYYVIGALLISICYISFSLFCWVSYNQKYQQRLLSLRRQKQKQRRNEMISHIPLSARSGKSKPSPKSNTFSMSPTSNRSSTHAPTTVSIKSRQSSWEIEDEEFKEVDYETGA